jgi:hypothetical protein
VIQIHPVGFVSRFYGQDFEQKYFEVMEVKYDWEQSLNRYKSGHYRSIHKVRLGQHHQRVQPLAHGL